MKDLIYYYDKVNLLEHELGEIQTNFNMSLVNDGTKDSMKVTVVSFSGVEITPNTIINHKATNTWWIISHDKVMREQSENTPRYKHELQLEGAIELLNARDFTDSGFNANRYSVGDFINRLFALSNFEFNTTEWQTSDTTQHNLFVQANGNIDLDKTVDYVKTFENYTLLSALREFLDGYNCSAKLSFLAPNGVLVGAVINIVSKTGNVNVVARNSDDLFKDPREIKNMDKSSYGTSVISNADNVISTKTKTFPSVGGVKLSSKTNLINGETGIIRLPSNAFKVNYIDMFDNSCVLGVALTTTELKKITFDSSDLVSCEQAYNEMVDYLETRSQTLAQEFLDNVKIEDLQKVNRRFYYCDNYDPTYDNGKGKFFSDKPINIIDKDNIGTNKDIPIVLTNSELQPTLSQPKYMGIYFTRGGNLIENFNLFDYDIYNHKKAYLHYNQDELLLYVSTETVGDAPYAFYLGDISFIDPNIYHTDLFHIFDIANTSFSVNYVPMSDIKIKLDNDGVSNDINLYNQNGKLTDSNALSKVLLSYSKEIESDTITRYGTFYGKYNSVYGFVSNLPNVGDLIKINNEYYVINNISIDFYVNEQTEPYGSSWGIDKENDRIGYYMTAEVSMSKKVATKSLITSPNTNIRDYGIPQNNNVKRKQVYRDFYEFTYERESTEHNWYLPLGKVLNLSNGVNEYQEHIAFILAIFKDLVNNKTTYCYQLETTTYHLKKSIYEIVDFKDNNIIGYGFQNLWSGFDISKIFIGNNDNYNTPISYVDDSGEVKGLHIAFSTIEDVKTAYDEYLNSISYSGDNVSIYNASVFVPTELLNIVANQELYDFIIEEPNYKKDALEVPVFEYSCQVDDTTNVIVGENILDSGNNDIAYLYQFALVDDITQFNDNNYSLNNFGDLTVAVNNDISFNSAVKFDFSHINDNEPYFTIKLYQTQRYNASSGDETLGNVVPLTNLTNKQLVIARHTITEDDIYENLVGELAYNTIQSTAPTPSIRNKGKYYVDNQGNYYLCQPDQYSMTLTTDSNIQAVNIDIVRDNVVITRTMGASETLVIDIYTGDRISWSAIPKSGYYVDGATMGGDGHITGSWTQGDGDYTKSFTCSTLSFYVFSYNGSVSGTYHNAITNEDVAISISEGQSQEIVIGYGGSYSFDYTPSSGYYTDNNTHYEDSDIRQSVSNIYLSATKYYDFNITINEGISSVTLTIGNVSNVYTSSTTVQAKQGLNYSFSTQIDTHYTNLTGGTGSGNTTITAQNPSRTISPTCEPKVYLVMGSSANGTVNFYEGEVIDPSTLNQCHYGSDMTWYITPNTNYNAPQNSSGSMVLNETNFNFSGTRATCKTAFEPCTLKVFKYTTGTLPSHISSITCYRTSSPLGNGSIGVLADNSDIYPQDELYFEATADTGYYADITNPSTNPLVVSGNVVGSSNVSAVANQYAITIINNSSESVTVTPSGTSVPATGNPTILGYFNYGSTQVISVSNSYGSSSISVTITGATTLIVSDTVSTTISTITATGTATGSNVMLRGSMTYLQVGATNIQRQYWSTWRITMNGDGWDTPTLTTNTQDQVEFRSMVIPNLPTTDKTYVAYYDYYPVTGVTITKQN